MASGSLHLIASSERSRKKKMNKNEGGRRGEVIRVLEDIILIVVVGGFLCIEHDKD